ncbi:Tripeptidyl-peptidase sed3 [Psilocybe cubensis]|uniref:Tripeptidyl-peptidase sed3 n=2 Tax=Psilocybe cubensis TaxID=181762 RepID=A0ACB8H445_PSICU|nr:Tripeptidyl-peptidase sed3 [Psilocybe cubensis]KAH9482489.1 Tripeptidyl-peptidase sed3 [Psilocybe cubensis]
MRSFSYVALLTSCLVGKSLVGALPSRDYAYSIKEEIDLPGGWVKHGDPPANHNIVLRIALPQPNFHVLEQHLYEISDPDHERYGQHLSKEEVEELVAPHSESLDLVNEWISSFGLTEDDLVRSPAKDWVTLKLPVSLVEKMLDTKYYVWQHAQSGDYLVRTTSYSLPSHLHDHVDTIQPTTSFGRFRKERSTIFSATPIKEVAASKSEPVHDPASGVTVDASCNQTITISCLQQMYNAVGFTPSAKGNSIGITGYLEQFANFADLQLFFQDQRPDAVNSSFKVVSVAGGLNNQTRDEAGDEADLDVEYAFGLSHPVPGTFFTTAGRPPFIPDSGETVDDNEPYTTWLEFVLSQKEIPLAISTSYGDDEQTVPKNFALRVCAEFAQLGARGVSVMFSSGDGGVGDGDPNPATQNCFTNDGKNRTAFIPGFPASVTAVGGTTHFPETAVTRFFSGGGFSNYFARPPYQEKVVPAYLKNSLPKGTYAGLFNPNGRAIPDVAAQGDLFKVFIEGQAFLIGGTSASSPTFTGFVALLNDVRLKAGRPPLGFLNPFIYSKGFLGLNDITVGHNSGCGTPGFNTSKGWDPGMGVYNLFPPLRDLLTPYSSSYWLRYPKFRDTQGTSFGTVTDNDG